MCPNLITPDTCQVTKGQSVFPAQPIIKSVLNKVSRYHPHVDRGPRKGERSEGKDEGERGGVCVVRTRWTTEIRKNMYRVIE